LRVRLYVNHQTRELEIPDGLSLLSALRDDLGLTGTRYGCGHGACGACTVLIDGKPVPACTVRAADMEGKPIVTIEGLAEYGELHPVQRAIVEEDALQCGYCTSGIIMAAVALLAEHPRPTDEEIREALAPHLCRCGVHGRVLRAVKRASQ